MLDEEDATAPLVDHAGQDVPEANGLLAIETGRGFVQQEQVEGASEAARQLDESTLAGRERSSLAAGEVADAAQLEGLGGGRGANAGVGPPGQQLGQRATAGLAGLAAEGHVVENGQRLA